MPGGNKRASVEVDYQVKVAGAEDVKSLGTAFTDTAKAGDRAFSDIATSAGKLGTVGKSLDGLPAIVAVPLDKAGRLIDQAVTDANTHLEKIGAGVTVTLPDIKAPDIDPLVPPAPIDLDPLPAPDTDAAAQAVRTAFDAPAADAAADLRSIGDTPVTVNVDTNSIKQLQGIDEAAGNAGESISGFASESAGALGGQFSDGIGLIADMGEQTRNLKGAFKEAGGGIDSFIKIASGVGVTAVLGVAFDAISGDMERANGLMADADGLIGNVTQQLIDQGGQWDVNTKKALVNSIAQSDTFQTLIAKGSDWRTTMDAFYKGDINSWKQVNAAVLGAADGADAEAIAALNAGAKMFDSGKKAQQAADYVLDYQDANGLAEDAADGAAGAAGRSASALFNVAGWAQTAADKVGAATSQNAAFNRNPVEDQAANVDVTTTGVDTAAAEIDGVAAPRTATVNVIAQGIQSVVDSLRAALGPLGVTLDGQDDQGDVLAMDAAPPVEDGDSLRLWFSGVDDPDVLYPPSHSGSRVATAQLRIQPTLTVINVYGALDSDRVGTQIARLQAGATERRYGKRIGVPQ